MNSTNDLFQATKKLSIKHIYKNLSKAMHRKGYVSGILNKKAKSLHNMQKGGSKVCHILENTIKRALGKQCAWSKISTA